MEKDINKLEEIIKKVLGIFTIIGIFSTLLFIDSLFNKDDNNIPACYEHELKIEELENEINDLRIGSSVEEDRNRELESNLEACKEDLDICLDDCGCASSGTSHIQLK